MLVQNGKTKKSLSYIPIVLDANWLIVVITMMIVLAVLYALHALVQLVIGVDILYWHRLIFRRLSLHRSDGFRIALDWLLFDGWRCVFLVFAVASE